MTRLALLALSCAFLALFFFPWPVAAALALLAAPIVPAGPLALGLVADALYFVPGQGALPLAAIFGALASAVALLVHVRLSTGIIAS